MHKVDDNGQVIVDWTTGDPEGDRATLFKAYRGFLGEIKEFCMEVLKEKDIKLTGTDVALGVLSCFNRWSISELNIDDFPRINIAFPEDTDEGCIECSEDCHCQGSGI